MCEFSDVERYGQKSSSLKDKESLTVCVFWDRVFMGCGLRDVRMIVSKAQLFLAWNRKSLCVLKL